MKDRRIAGTWENYFNTTENKMNQRGVIGVITLRVSGAILYIKMYILMYISIYFLYLYAPQLLKTLNVSRWHCHEYKTLLHDGYHRLLCYYNYLSLHRYVAFQHKICNIIATIVLYMEHHLRHSLDNSKLTLWNSSSYY